MVSMGLDLSLTETGLYILDDSSGWEHSKLIKVKNRGIKRIAEIWGQISEELSVYQPKIVLLEGYSYASRGSAVTGQAELGGVVRYHLFMQGIFYYDVAPTQLKKYATGVGNACKERVVLSVYKKWGKEFYNNNLADSYVLAQMGLATVNDEGLTVPQKAVLEKIQVA